MSDYKNFDCTGRTALITGITGQDGSYLLELLIEKGYKVYGLIRRSSTHNTGRIDKMLEDYPDRITLLNGDMTDATSLYNAVRDSQPDEIYNLAAQSHVGISFDMPEYTQDCTGTGCLRLLEAMRALAPPGCRFYQAATSELFGDVLESPQTEHTPFNVRSPYAAAKEYAFNIVRNYREAYGVFACNGVLFNHETITYATPIIIKKDGIIDILPIGDVARFHTGVNFDMSLDYQEGEPIDNIEVWDKSGWTKIKYVSGYPHKGDKNPKIINSRNTVYAATGSHVCIMDDNSEIKTEDMSIGNKVKLIKYPELTNKSNAITLNEAELLGMLVGDGSLHRRRVLLSNKEMEIKEKFAALWHSFAKNPRHTFRDTLSGFTGEVVGQVHCYGDYDGDLDVYTNDMSPFGHKTKKIPKVILNSSKEIMEAFLIGYNVCDGLKKNRCTYRFKNFKTNSHTLASGLLYLVSKVTGQEYNITVDESEKWGKRQFYYSINLLSDNTSNSDKKEVVLKLLSNGDSQRSISRQSGISRGFIRKVAKGYVPKDHHLKLQKNEVKKVIDIPEYDGWFFDLATESGTFHCGAGQGVVHNSPRRGEDFVTRKISLAAARISKGEQNILKLGNLDSLRDWGHAKDYIYGMWLMLQQDSPDDFILATGQACSVQDFCDECFSAVGIDLEWEGEGLNKVAYRKSTDAASPRVVCIKVDASLYRPSDVNSLLGNPTKARVTLGWKPTYNMQKLAREMALSDLDTKVF